MENHTCPLRSNFCSEASVNSCWGPSYLPLLEGVPGQVPSAGRLEQRDVPPGLNVALLLQPGQCSCSEEDLREDRTSSSAISDWCWGQSGHNDAAANICHLGKKFSFNLRCISGVMTESICIYDKGARINGHVPTQHLTISQKSQYPITLE